MPDKLMKCTECSWRAHTIEDQEYIDDSGDPVSLAHIGCPECGGMLTYQSERAA